MKSLIFMLFNIKLNRWHPIVYFESPMPGPYDPNQTFVRLKSRMHHTSGFEDEQAAWDSLAGLANNVKEHTMFSDVTIEKVVEEWDGEDNPVDVIIRPIEDGKLVTKVA